MTAPRPARLPPRLSALAALVPPGARLADVGSDHGLLPLALLASGRVRLAVATERTAARAARIRRPPAGASWADRFSVRSGDGLSPLRREDGIDTVVVAGLGGRTILRILGGPALERAAPRVLVLQPRTEEAAVRAWLSARGFLLDAETLVADRGRLHLTLRATPGDDAGLYRDAVLSRADLLAAGPLIVRARPPEAILAWRRERERLVALAGKGRTDGAAAERAERILARLSGG